MKKLFISLIAVVSMTFVVACYAPKEVKPAKPAGGSTVSEEIACNTKGGVWKRVGLGQFYACVIAMPDAGKSCTDSSQCEGRCLTGAGGMPDEGNKQVTGSCQATNQPFGCFSEVENGVAGPGLCID